MITAKESGIFPVVRKKQIQKIFDLIEEKYGVSKEDLVSENRKKCVADARALSMYLMRTGLGFAFKHIGEIFNRKHSSVIFACRKVEKQLSDPQQKEEIRVFLNALGKDLSECSLPSPRLSFSVYKLSFPDGSEYVGVSSNLETRLAEHKSSIGGVIRKKKMECTITEIETGLSRKKAFAREREEISKLSNPINIKGRKKTS